MGIHQIDDWRSDRTDASDAIVSVQDVHERRQTVVLHSGAPMDVARNFLVRRHGHNVRPTLLRHRGEFFYWSGTHYELRNEEAVRSFLYDFLDTAELAQPNGGSRPFEPNKNKVTNVLDALKAQTLVGSALDTPSWLLAGEDTPAGNLISCRNGLLDLATKALGPHTPAYFNVSSLPYDYDPDAAAPVNWLKFLDELYADDMCAIRCLQEMFGYMLAADTSQQKIFFIVGPARSGKGTIARVLTAFLGEHNVIAPTLSSLGANFGLQGFIGKQAAIVHDARLSGRSDQQVIVERLLSISGEDNQSIERKFQTDWTGRLPTRFLILSNELPAVADASGALASRFITFALQNSFLGQEDRGLTKRLLGELPGILNWAIEGWANLSECGSFEQPASSAEVILELEAATSPIKAFVRDCCVVGPEHSVGTADLYQAWRNWCEASGEIILGRFRSSDVICGQLCPVSTYLSRASRAAAACASIKASGFSIHSEAGGTRWHARSALLFRLRDQTMP